MNHTLMICLRYFAPHYSNVYSVHKMACLYIFWTIHHFSIILRGISKILMYFFSLSCNLGDSVLIPKIFLDVLCTIRN